MNSRATRLHRGLALEHVLDHLRDAGRAAVRCSCARLQARACRACGRASPRAGRAPTSWVVNALVDATPISGPALVRTVSSASRVIALPITLQSASVRGAARLGLLEGRERVGRLARLADGDGQVRARRRSGRGSGTRWRARPPPGCAPASRSSACRRGPSASVVPHARMVICVSASHLLGLEVQPSKCTSPSERSTRPRRVSATARGCSWISLCMKCLWPPFSAIIGVQSMRRVARFTGCAARG